MDEIVCVSIIVPCFNEGEALSAFIRELDRVFQELTTIQKEVIFINDGSNDQTLAEMKALAATYPFVRWISFSRNFGKESAMLAGFQAARGDYAAVMDADLQDPPSLLPDMLRAVQYEGYDCVGTRRTTRSGEPPIRSFCARMFYRLINLVSDMKLVDGARDYKLLSRKAVNALLSMPEYNRFSKGLYEWIGFRTKWFEFENVGRIAGETKWSFWKLFRYSLEGILSFTVVPLALASILGLIFTVVAMNLILVLCIRQLIFHDSIDGWTSEICIMLLLSGIQLFCIGIAGQYLAKMYLEIKQRPHYIIDEMSDSPQLSSIHGR